MSPGNLAHCDNLFERYLSPWYSDGFQRAATRPDLYRVAAYEGQPLDLRDLQFLPEEYLKDAQCGIVEIQEAAAEDYREIAEFDVFDLRALDAIDKFYDRNQVLQLLEESEPTDYDNPYLISVCEFGSMLGSIFQRRNGFGWLYSYPYFDSIIVHAPSGHGIPVFDWAVKKFSGYGVDDGFAAKVNAALHEIETPRG